MKLTEGDKLVKGTKTFRVCLVTDNGVMLEGGEWVDMDRIERDVKHDRTRVFYK